MPRSCQLTWPGNSFKVEAARAEANLVGGRHQLDDLARVQQTLLRPSELVERARPRIVQLGRVGNERDGLRAERLSSKSFVRALAYTGRSRGGIHA